jgi:F420-dependent oxidoreductase-like protein
MKLATFINYVGDFPGSVKQVVEMEKAGLDTVWVAEAYSFDAISQIGFLAARTETVEIGTSILNVYSRTPALMAMTAAGCDYVSGGRFNLGIGASGPQVVEGFHGVPYDKPMQRTIEYIEVCRDVWRREAPLEYHGRTVDVPLTTGGTGLGKALKIINHPVRPNIPIWWASLMTRSVEATAQYADGWQPLFFMPEKFREVWGSALDAGLAKRDPALAPLQIATGGLVAIDESLVGEEQTKVLDRTRGHLALYVGGMGARGKNFYNTITQQYGFEAEAKAVQDLYLDGKKAEAAAALPAEMVEKTNLVGPKSYVAERLAAYREAGVTTLQITMADDPVRTIDTLRELLG